MRITFSPSLARILLINNIMKTIINLILIVLFSSMSTNAQISAGDIPLGMSAINPNVNISLLNNNTEDTVSFDLDCDGINDILAKLKRGITTIDIPNNAELHIINPALQFCKDTNAISYFSRPNYYNFGMILNCDSAFNWSSDSIMILGDVGTMTSTGPFSMTDIYVAYQLGTQLGWINLSFDLFEITPTPDITLDIHEVLSPCTPSVINSNDNSIGFNVWPNPSKGGKLKIYCQEKIRSYAILDLTGKLIQADVNPLIYIQTPTVSGTYLIFIQTELGNTFRKKLIVY